MEKRMEDVVMQMNKRGNVEMRLSSNVKLTLKGPPWPAIRKGDGDMVVFEFAPDMMIPIADVAALSGYHSMTLHNLNKSGDIPASSGVLPDGSRTWRASDVLAIFERRQATMGRRER
jgi:hypothetical protein